MFKFVTLDAVLNYIPEAIKEEESAQQLKSWAFQLFSTLNFEFRWDYKISIVPVIQHKACIPKGALKIAYVGYNLYDYSNKIQDFLIKNYPNGLDDEDKRLILYQSVFVEQSLVNSYKPLRYVGTSPNLLTNDCVNVFCKDCHINFSFDKMLNNITLDEKEGYVLIIYGTHAKEETDLIIPDDANLLQACAYYAQAQHWLNRASRHEANGMNMHTQFLQMSSNLLTKFKGSHILKNINSNNVKKNTFGAIDFHKGLKRRR
jgi:hypothetical protein